MSTPLMQQYHQVKAKYPDTILLFRMGDFFETFEEDAKTTSRVLGITLTRRGAGSAGEVPLAGFPHHALETYLPKLLKAGLRVAVCEQIEDPKLAQGIVKRDVIEVVTPGVAFSDKVLEQKQNNYLMAVALPSAIASAAETIGLSYVDISTGEFCVTEIAMRELKEQVMALAPAEILVQKRDKDSLRDMLASSCTSVFTSIDDWVMQYEYAYETLIRHFRTQSLKGFGLDAMSIGITASGAVMHYLNETQKSNLAHIQKIVPYSTSDSIVLDIATKRNLEITSSFGGTTEGTLFSVIDRTSTPMGARLLKKWISQPLKDLAHITWRLDGVSSLVEYSSVRASLTAQLSDIGDMERLIAKIATGRANPREMLALKSILERLPIVKHVIATAVAEHQADSSGVSLQTLGEIGAGLILLDDLACEIGAAIADDPPAKLDDGGVIRDGFSAELDEIRRLSFSGKEWIANLQQKERERTGISSLKIGFNNVFGYYIEITHTNRDKVPPEYIRKQTMTNAERFITPELKEYEDKVLNAEERILALESRLFNELRVAASRSAADIQHNARQIAVLDCLVSLAAAAEEHHYTRPEVNEGAVLEIEEGRHPVIETLLPVGDTYIPNSVRLDTAGEQVLIITGPNMSGKSSFLRQVGLIVLLAQSGSFVPARRATVGIVDHIFTRVGASDNISSGESTFLVEMHEAANIVNRATERSLILLDEVGRGTSTFDGISIAWALTEYLHERIGARTLFATHYHELNELAGLLPRIRNYKVDVREYGDKVIFLHTVTPGTADHSYGIQVAMMAGLPQELTDRAKTILKNLESSELTLHTDADEKPKRAARHAQPLHQPSPQITMFELKDDEIRSIIKKADIDRMTPLDALKLLAKLKEQL